jgi:RNA polymerase sigma-70 factor (ECF subfamily)
MSDPDPPPLADLLSRATAGDSAALSELLRRYERRVRLAARLLLRQPLRPYLDSLDLVQSVHRALLPGLRGGRYALADEDQLVALAVTVLRNKVHRAARRARPAAPLAAAAEPSARDAAPADESRDRVLAALDGPDRRIVELRLEDRSTAEIAADLGLTPAVVRARLSRLRARLRDAGFADLG